jgi:hypothetical protein
MDKVLQLDLLEKSTFSPQVHKHLQNLAILGLPKEVCGLIYPGGVIVQYPNIHHRPQHAFDFEAPLDRDIQAMWHSHPHGLEAPSSDDLPCIKTLVDHGYFFHHIIVTSKRVLEYRPSLVDPQLTLPLFESCS